MGMIAYVSGKLVEKWPTSVLIDVNDIGYLLRVPTSTSEMMPPRGIGLKLWTYHYVRENTEELFGFWTQDERTAFEMLFSVSGVGPKTALLALSAMGPKDLVQHIKDHNIPMLMKIKGVGRKTAQRIAFELSEKLSDYELSHLNTEARGNTVARLDACHALETLGMTATESKKRVHKVIQADSELSKAEEIVQAALRL